MENIEIYRNRNYKIQKSNELIQKARFDFTVQQQKIILYLISRIKPEQKKFEYEEFDIQDFCKICGIDQTSGKNYSDLKKTIKNISDKSFWVTFNDNSEKLLRWIDNVEVKNQSGALLIKLDDNMKPFLLEIKEFTQYNLVNTLGMDSKYSIRLYELLKSYQNKNEAIIFQLDRFQNLVGSNYEKWYDVRRKVIEPAMREINGHTDITVRYEVEKKGRAVNKIIFEVEGITGHQEQFQVRLNQNEKLSKKVAVKKKSST